MARKLVATFDAMVAQSTVEFGRLAAIAPKVLEELDCVGPGCGRSFVPSNRRQKVCSPACRQALHDRKKRQAKPLVTAPIANGRSGGSRRANNVRRKPRSKGAESDHSRL
ncbi:MAG: hypothetical protein ACRDVW_05555, partial [Acidimicrobiales bacterium]